MESGSAELGEEMDFSKSQNKRVVSYAVLEDISDSESNGVRFVVFATHWSSGTDAAALAELHGKQAESMSRIMREVLSHDDYARLPVVVAGDFNTYYSSEAYQRLLTDGGLTDAEASENGVDHIATARCRTDSLAFMETEATKPASDHYPIYCNIKIGG